MVRLAVGPATAISQPVRPSKSPKMPQPQIRCDSLRSDLALVRVHRAPNTARSFGYALDRAAFERSDFAA